MLDGWGGIHPVGASPALTANVLWPHRDLAQSLGLFPDGTGGYVMDAFGGLHPIGSAPAAPSGAYWPDWNIAREVVMAPWSSSADPAGYVLDGWGGVHPYNGAPGVTTSAYWKGWDIARGLASRPDRDAAPAEMMISHQYTLETAECLERATEVRFTVLSQTGMQ